ncbi:MAG: hypothetical protein MUO21_10455 [Nitrososphaeraceae archaeon]|nr:hypothetical protein [Nitrososphaeraceae archaeon]
MTNENYNRPTTCINFNTRYSSLSRFKTPEEVANYFYQTMGHLYGHPENEMTMPRLKRVGFFTKRSKKIAIKAYNRWVLEDFIRERTWWKYIGNPNLICRNFDTRPDTLAYLTTPQDVADYFNLLEATPEERSWWCNHGIP